MSLARLALEWRNGKPRAAEVLSSRVKDQADAGSGDRRATFDRFAFERSRGLEAFQLRMDRRDDLEADRQPAGAESGRGRKRRTAGQG